MINSNLHEVILFLIEQTHKITKQHTAAEFVANGIDVTVDQWILMKFVQENPNLSQTQIAKETFKDVASITRILNLLETKNLIKRDSVRGNKRQLKISLTKQGEKFINKHTPFVEELRDQSIKGLNEDEILTLTKSLLQIQQNCES